MTHLYILYAEDSPFEPSYAIGPAGLEPQVRAATRLPSALMHEHLLACGLEVVDASVISHDPQKPFWEGAYVRFPQDAGHEYAGKTLALAQAADGLPMLVDPDHGDLLAADDMPLRQVPEPSTASRAGQLLVTEPAFEQVPLGPVWIPEGQFDGQTLEALIGVLEAAGYEVQQRACESMSTE